MSPIVIMDKASLRVSEHRHTRPLEYRLPDDQLNFWTGRYQTAGEVQAFLCASCGRIALYGSTPEEGSSQT
jgi:hypothetical protein